MLFFPIWLAGALLLVIPRRNLRPSARVAATAVYIAIFFGQRRRRTRAHGPYQCHPDADYSTAFFWVLPQTNDPPTAQPNASPASPPASPTRSTSSTCPSSTSLAGFVVHDTPWLPTLRNNVVALTLLLVVIFYAWLVARATEFNLIPVLPPGRGQTLPPSHSLIHLV